MESYDHKVEREVNQMRLWCNVAMGILVFMTLMWAVTLVVHCLHFGLDIFWVLEYSILPSCFLAFGLITAGVFRKLTLL